MAEVPPLVAGDPARIGDYWLLGRLGGGGQGMVYLGRDHAGNRVAVKALRDYAVAEPELRERFAREVAAARRVASFCTARIIDADLEGPRPYIVSEYVQGPSLWLAVRQVGPLRGDALSRLATGVATALAAIHKAGVVHRDLKPDNVLLGPDGPRVIDFGLARMHETTLTQPGTVMGTPSYMAPEVFLGERVGTANDVWAWGGVVYFAATGRNPFGEGEVAAIMHRILMTEPALDGIDEPLRSLVADALTKDPHRRPAAQDLLLRLLGQAVGPRKPAAQPPQATSRTPPQPTPRRQRVRLRLIAASGLAAVLLASGAALAASRSGSGVAPAQTPAPQPAAAPGAAGRHTGHPVGKWRGYVAYGASAFDDVLELTFNGDRASLQYLRTRCRLSLTFSRVEKERQVYGSRPDGPCTDGLDRGGGEVRIARPADGRAAEIAIHPRNADFGAKGWIISTKAPDALTPPPVYVGTWRNSDPGSTTRITVAAAGASRVSEGRCTWVLQPLISINGKLIMRTSGGCTAPRQDSPFIRAGDTLLMLSADDYLSADKHGIQVQARDRDGGPGARFRSVRS